MKQKIDKNVDQNRELGLFIFQMLLLNGQLLLKEIKAFDEEDLFCSKTSFTSIWSLILQF